MGVACCCRLIFWGLLMVVDAVWGQAFAFLITIHLPGDGQTDRHTHRGRGWRERGRERSETEEPAGRMVSLTCGFP